MFVTIITTHLGAQYIIIRKSNCLSALNIKKHNVGIKFLLITSHALLYLYTNESNNIALCLTIKLQLSKHKIIQIFFNIKKKPITNALF